MYTISHIQCHLLVEIFYLLQGLYLIYINLLVSIDVSLTFSLTVLEIVMKKRIVS